MMTQDLRVPQQQTTDYFQAVRGSLQAFQDGSLGTASHGLGQAMISTTPIVAAARAMKRNRVPMNGLGQNGLGQTDGFATLAVVAVAFVAVTGALSYQAGKAMAPNRKKGSTWGWVGVPVGLFLGPWGLGVMGIVSNTSRK